MREEGQSAVFVLLHNSSFSGAFVVDAAEVEDAVDNGAVELFVIRSGELLGVGPNGVEAYEEVARYLVFGGLVEGDYIGVVVVPEVLAVYLQNFFVRAEDVADVSGLFPVGLRHCLYPKRYGVLIDGRKGGVFCVE